MKVRNVHFCCGVGGAALLLSSLPLAHGDDHGPYHVTAIEIVFDNGRVFMLEEKDGTLTLTAGKNPA